MNTAQDYRLPPLEDYPHSEPYCTRCKGPVTRGRDATGLLAHALDAPGLIGRLVEDAHDDSACPTVGKVVGQIDADTLEVLWGERRFEKDPRPGSYEPLEALRLADRHPVELGWRPRDGAQAVTR